MPLAAPRRGLDHLVMLADVPCARFPRRDPIRVPTLSRLALAAAFTLGCHSAAEPSSPPRSSPAGPLHSRPPPAPLYLVVYSPGAAFRAGKPLAEQPLREHFAYLLSLHREGALVAAGGFDDERGGALALAAPDAAAALAIVRSDPAVKDSVFQFELRRWQLVDWARHAAGPSGAGAGAAPQGLRRSATALQTLHDGSRDLLAGSGVGPSRGAPR